jgi:SM-20-related protein
LTCACPPPSVLDVRVPAGSRSPLEDFDRISASIAAQGWIEVPDFIGEDLVQALGTESLRLAEQGAFYDAAIGHDAQERVDGQVRADQISWLDTAGSSEAQRQCLARFEDLRLRLNRDLQLGLFEFECHFARYARGAFYRRHLDQFSRDSRRCLSVVLYLNAAWETHHGGALRLYLDRTPDAASVDITPVGGKLVLFLSERFPHEVLPATRERLSLTGWFKTRS